MEDMIKMFDGIQKDRFLIECLRVIDQALQEEKNNSNEFLIDIKSITDLFDRINGNNTSDIDKILQDRVQYILSKDGVLKKRQT